MEPLSAKPQPSRSRIPGTLEYFYLHNYYCAISASQHCGEAQVEHTYVLTVFLALELFLVHQTTWLKVNRDFGSIFSTLLPGTSAKLQPPEGETVMAGLEVSPQPSF